MWIPSPATSARTASTPAGGARTLHGSTTELRLRPTQGHPGAGTGCRARLPAAGLLRLQRLGDRPAAVADRRAPVRGEPGPEPAAALHRTGVGASRILVAW